MKALFKYSRTVNGVHYAKGSHDFPEALVGHWFVEALVKAGDISFPDKPKAKKVEAKTAETVKPKTDAELKEEKEKADFEAELAKEEAEAAEKAKADKAKEKPTSTTTKSGKGK